LARFQAERSLFLIRLVSDFDVAESRRSDALVIWSIWTSTKLVYRFSE
jgi:hypothetical protein